MSCQNLFSSAHNSLQKHPNIQKVIIMEHSPRFDEKDLDPIGLKPALVNYANSIFNQLWLDSPFKNKISIGKHSLNTSSSGREHNESYKNTKNGKYDGVHFFGIFGRNKLSGSVQNIFKNSFPKFKSQESNSKTNQKTQQNEEPSQTRYHPSVKVNNRFSVFNSNLGNL